MARTKLGQILAVERAVKQKSYSDLTLADRQFSKGELLLGRTRTYEPKDDDGERFPDEGQRLQIRAPEILDEVTKSLTRLFNVVATKDDANTRARADVVLNGTTILTGVPATTLLFLEKQLKDFHTFMSRAPVLDPRVDWEWSDEKNAYVSEPIVTTKTKKVPRVLVKAAATEKHPAQTDVWQEDVVVGEWATTHFSGSFPASRIKEVLYRIEQLQEAVKFAREKANQEEVIDQEIARPIFEFLLR